MWNTRTVQVIQIVVGSFASVTKNLEKWLESWTQELVFHCPPKTTLLGTERILRKVLVSSRVRSRNLRVPLMGHDSLPQQVQRYGISRCTKKEIIMMIIIMIIIIIVIIIITVLVI